jgi:hypothetical protein
MKAAGVARFVVLLSVFGCQASEPVPSGKEEAPPRAKVAGLPATVREAVDTIVSQMPEEDQARLRATRRNDLINDLHSWGRGIRNAFGLWGENKALLESCGTDSPERASMVIMEAVWDRVQKR